MKWKLLAIISTTLLLVTLVPVLSRWWGQRNVDTPSMVLQIRQLKQLVTVRYSIQRVIGITEPKDPFGSESILLMVEGEALAGVDLANLTPSDFILSDSNRKALIALPPAQLIDAYLNEKQTRVWDRHVTWWTPWVP